jgi:Tir chaperone protein (CesT) family
MRTDKDVEAYLLRLNRRFRTLEGKPGTYLVEMGDKTPTLVLRVEAPLVVVRVHVADVKAEGKGDDGPLFRRLLEANARQLVHAAYGLDEGRIVLSSALELENLDFNELQATLDEIEMALAQAITDAGPAPKG